MASEHEVAWMPGGGVRIEIRLNAADTGGLPSVLTTPQLGLKDSGKEESTPPTKPPYPPEFRRDAVN